MDKETRHELQRLFRALEEGLHEIRLADTEDRELMGWRKIQMTAFELNQVLPAAEHQLPA
jgi:hypothetical protein